MSTGKTEETVVSLPILQIVEGETVTGRKFYSVGGKFFNTYEEALAYQQKQIESYEKRHKVKVEVPKETKKATLIKEPLPEPTSTIKTAKEKEELAKTYAEKTGASYEEVLETFEKHPSTVKAVESFLEKNYGYQPPKPKQVEATTEKVTVVAGEGGVGYYGPKEAVGEALETGILGETLKEVEKEYKIAKTKALWEQAHGIKLTDKQAEKLLKGETVKVTSEMEVEPDKLVWKVGDKTFPTKKAAEEYVKKQIEKEEKYVTSPDKALREEQYRVGLTVYKKPETKTEEKVAEKVEWEAKTPMGESLGKFKTKEEAEKATKEFLEKPLEEQAKIEGWAKISPTWAMISTAEQLKSKDTIVGGILATPLEIEAGALGSFEAYRETATLAGIPQPNVPDVWGAGFEVFQIPHKPKVKQETIEKIVAEEDWEKRIFEYEPPRWGDLGPETRFLVSHPAYTLGAIGGEVLQAFGLGKLIGWAKQPASKLLEKVKFRFRERALAKTLAKKTGEFKAPEKFKFRVVEPAKKQPMKSILLSEEDWLRKFEFETKPREPPKVTVIRQNKPSQLVLDLENQIRKASIETETEIQKEIADLAGGVELFKGKTRKPPKEVREAIDWLGRLDEAEKRIQKSMLKRWENVPLEKRSWKPKFEEPEGPKVKSGRGYLLLEQPKLEKVAKESLEELAKKAFSKPRVALPMPTPGEDLWSKIVGKTQSEIKVEDFRRMDNKLKEAIKQVKQVEKAEKEKQVSLPKFEVEQEKIMEQVKKTSQTVSPKRIVLATRKQKLKKQQKALTAPKVKSLMGKVEQTLKREAKSMSIPALSFKLKSVSPTLKHEAKQETYSIPVLSHKIFPTPTEKSTPIFESFPIPKPIEFETPQITKIKIKPPPPRKPPKIKFDFDFKPKKRKGKKWGYKLVKNPVKMLEVFPEKGKKGKRRGKRK